MTDPRKLLARLNPQNARYEIGSGGRPEWTSGDIAAALGMVRNLLGREILCAVWWPDGSQLTREALLANLRDLQLAEWVNRARRLECAHLAEHLAAELAAEKHGPMGATLHHARADVAAARAMMWPRLGPASLYAAIRTAVLAEMLDPHLCTECRGTAHVMMGGLLVPCGVCKGSGHSKASDDARARSLGRDPKTYRTTWRDPYEWLLDLCATAERAAAHQFTQALGLEKGLDIPPKQATLATLKVAPNHDLASDFSRGTQP